MNAPAAQHFGPHLFGVVAHLAPPVVAVGGAHGGADVASADDVAVLDDDCAHGFLEAGGTFFEDETDVEESFVDGGSELADDVFVVSCLGGELRCTMVE